MAPLAVHLRSAVVLLDRFPALAGVDLDVGVGEVVHVQGPNGAGKSTLLRTCAGLLPVVGGHVEVLGHDLRRDRRSFRRRVGLLGHANFLYDELTVAQNLDFAVRAGGGHVDRVGPAVERLGLDHRLLSVSAGRLSAGQRRRVALAALVARGPDLWLLDEPHAGLDGAGRDLLDGLVSEAAGSGATVLIASHDKDRATLLADRAITVAGGHVRSDVLPGEPIDVS